MRRCYLSAIARRLKSFAAAVSVLAAWMLLPPTGAAALTLPDGFAEETIVDGLKLPTAVEWVPDGRMFIAEKDGKVRVVDPDGTLLRRPLIDLTEKVNSDADRGLLGLAADTDFDRNGYLYLLYTYELQPDDPDTDAPMVGRLTRVTVRPDNKLENPADPEKVILGSVVDGPCPQPNNEVDCIPQDFHWHATGAVRSDPVDGTLWVGIGNAHEDEPDELSYRPYDPTSYAGKILHISRNGKGLPDHPFCAEDADLSHICTKVYALGFRNPYRFTLRSEGGPIVGDPGAGKEEINFVEEGENYGWPCYEGYLRQPDHEDEPRCIEEYEKQGTAEAAVRPTWSYRGAGGKAVIAGPVYTGSSYPSEYAGKTFVADYIQGWIRTLSIDTGGEVVGAEDFATEVTSPVDLSLTPEGDLAYVDIGFDGSGSIRRLVHEGNSELPAVPVVVGALLLTLGIGFLLVRWVREPPASGGGPAAG